MAKVICPKCSNQFEAKDYLVKSGAMAAGAATGAWLGSMIGIAGGPFGAIAGTIPGAIIGGTFGWLGISKFSRCPKCGKVLKI